jgi:hypothetical protein
LYNGEVEITDQEVIDDNIEPGLSNAKDEEKNAANVNDDESSDEEEEKSSEDSSDVEDDNFENKELEEINFDEMSIDRDYDFSFDFDENEEIDLSRCINDKDLKDIKDSEFFLQCISNPEPNLSIYFHLLLPVVTSSPSALTLRRFTDSSNSSNSLRTSTSVNSSIPNICLIDVHKIVRHLFLHALYSSLCDYAVLTAVSLRLTTPQLSLNSSVSTIESNTSLVHTSLSASISLKRAIESIANSEWEFVKNLYNGEVEIYLEKLEVADRRKSFSKPLQPVVVSTLLNSSPPSLSKLHFGDDGNLSSTTRTSLAVSFSSTSNNSKEVSALSLDGDDSSKFVSGGKSKMKNEFSPSSSLNLKSSPPPSQGREHLPHPLSNGVVVDAELVGRVLCYYCYYYYYVHFYLRLLILNTDHLLQKLYLYVSTNLN